MTGEGRSGKIEATTDRLSVSLAAVASLSHPMSPSVFSLTVQAETTQPRPERSELSCSAVIIFVLVVQAADAVNERAFEQVAWMEPTTEL